MVDWTSQQKEAIEARGSHLLVSAAAGSGKTAVLVARILDMIEKSRTDIDAFLIVTFTNAAAAEMREKLLKALSESLEAGKGSPERAEFLRRQMNRLNRASIQTLHGFCLEVIRAGFHVIDLDPEFRIADDLERSLLREEALEEVLEEAYARRDPSFLNLVEAFSGSKDDGAFKEVVKSLHTYALSMPDPWEWLSASVEAFNQSGETIAETAWAKELQKELSMELSEILEAYDRLLALAEEPDGPLEYREALWADRVLAEELKRLSDVDLEAYALRIGALDSSDFVRRKGIGKDRRETVAPEKDDRVKNGRDALKKRLLGLKRRYFDCSLEITGEQLSTLYPDMLCLSDLAKALDDRYGEKKAERRLLDFNDLEHHALDILDNEAMAARFREKYEQIFIDEYQDNNRMQEALINRIRRKDNVFMVGDVKQSIYRFRLAEPGIFLEKYHRYGQPQGGGRRIVLNRNFRSREAILEAVNFLFGRIMRQATGEIDYDEDARLNPGKAFPSERGESVEVHVLEKTFDEENEDIDDEIADLNHTQAEAVLTARLIKGLMGQAIYDPVLGAYRPVRCRDIVLLSRAAKHWADVFVEELTREGIPVYADNSGGYFETLEIKLLVDLLKLIDNRRQDIPLLSVLRSPVGGFSIEELTAVRLAFPEGPFHEAFSRYGEAREDELALEIKGFHERIDSWSRKARYMNLDDFIWRLVESSGYLAYVSAMPGGIRRRENIKILLERAAGLSGGVCKSLFDFIRFIEEVLKSRGDMDTAALLGEKDDVVRIMTVHKSKGLEFPVVILTGLGKRMRRASSRHALSMHRDLGLGCKAFDAEKRVFRETLPQKAIAARSRRESVAEEMRILYVAMTRAVDRLILVGSERDIQKAWERWVEPLTDHAVLNAVSFFDWIMGPLTALMDETDLLAAQSGREVRLKGEGHQWRIKTHGRSTLSKGQPEAADPFLRRRIETFDFKPDPEMAEVVSKGLSWAYPHRQAALLPSKLTVTALNRLKPAGFRQAGYSIPALLKDPLEAEAPGGPDAREIGDFYHKVMQHLDLRKSLALENREIMDQIRGMSGRGLLNEEAMNHVDPDRIRVFFASSLGGRLLASSEVRRELPFVLKKPANELKALRSEAAETDAILVQGVIDCVFREERGWVLLDYKTGKVWRKGAEQAVEAYRTQLEVYREALEKLTGMPVLEGWLYFFGSDRSERVF